MAFSLGELFLSLGFDVDESKLKSFKSGLRDTHEEMAKLGTIAAGTLTAITAFANKQADIAVHLTNTSALWGGNAEAAQKYANALHMVNNQVSIAAGEEKYRAFSEMINSKVPMGSAPYAALSRLGVTNPWGSPEDVMGQIFKSLPSQMKGFASEPGKQRAIASDLLSQVGLGDSLGIFTDGGAAYDKAGKYTVGQGKLDQWKSLANSTSELDVAFSKLAGDMAEIAPILEKGIHNLVAGINWLDKFNADHPGAGTAETIGAGAVGTIGSIKAVKWLASLVGGGSGGVAAAAEGAGGIGAMGGAGIVGAMASIPWVASWAGDELGKSIKEGRKSSLKAIFPSFSDDQISGIMHALNDESGGDPSTYGHGTEAKGGSQEAYGMPQWHKDRISALEKAGFKIYGATREQQLAAINYELTQGMEKSAGDKIMQTQGANEAYLTTKKYYERPSGAKNIVINVHSNATDNHQVAQLVQQHFQKSLNSAFAQTDLGADQ